MYARIKGLFKVMHSKSVFNFTLSHSLGANNIVAANMAKYLPRVNTRIS